MDYKIIFAIVATIISVVSFFPYLRDIFKLKTKPHTYTWLIWFITQGIAVAGIYYGGGGIGALELTISTTLVALVLIFSFKYGTTNITKTDTFILIIALLAIVVWWKLDNPLAAVLIVATIDVLGFIPSLRKSFYDPWSETVITWVGFAIGNCFAILALREYNLLTLSYIVSIATTNAILAIVCIVRRRSIPKHPEKTNISLQFTDPRLVSTYDSLNALGDDSDFWLSEIEKLSPQTIIDLGCGTGLLTCELAKRGYTMIGVEPARAMLDIARQKPYADKVQWIEGGYEKFEGLQADLILMTSHVAQFFLDDSEWQAMLKASYKALTPGGHIMFDSRTPIFPPYQTWPTEASPRRVEDPKVGSIDWWYKLLEIKNNRVKYQLSYHFINSNETVTSTDELIFRSQEEIKKSLESEGFKLKTIYGDWDGSPATPSSEEMIFVAIKPTN
jgi:SAM-dependent methyltransferase